MPQERAADILQVAVDHHLLTAEQASELRRDADHDASTASDLAIQRNLIDAADLDALRPLVDSETYLPGYTFLKLIGEGAMGTVYLAKQARLDRQVALKLLKPSRLKNQTATARSQLEARVGAKMHHPNIVTTHDYGVHQGRIYLAMEFVEGESLLDRIEQSGRIGERVALQIIRQVASALAHANELGVVHRDIKPANLLLTNARTGFDLPPDVPRVQVADFGLAFQIPDHGGTRLTAAGSTLGTPSYMAPEQFTNSAVDCRADIYALGTTLFHMLRGVEPFAGANMFRVMTWKMAGNESWRDALDDDEYSPGIIRLFRAMTERNPEERIADYRHLKQSIDELLFANHSPSSTQPSTPPQDGSHSQEVRPMRWTRVAIGAVTVLVMLVLATWKLSSRRSLPEALSLEPDGWERFLFDGFSAPRGRQSGTWIPTADAVGANVLAGTDGWLTLEPPLPDGGQPEHYRFQAGINQLEGGAAEIHFGMADIASRTATRYVVRLADGSASLGTRVGIDGDFQLDRNAPPIELPTANDGPIYQTVAVVRQPDGWIVFVNGTQLGRLPPFGQHNAWNVMLVARGTAHFETLKVVRLKRSDIP